MACMGCDVRTRRLAMFAFSKQIMHELLSALTWMASKANDVAHMVVHALHKLGAKVLGRT